VLGDGGRPEFRAVAGNAGRLHGALLDVDLATGGFDLLL